eukprot:m.477889 g.477889  ORF g.477889 m.477889 type:complete len:75 (+) comp21689_c0_seq11:2477-2701(+)
MHCHDMSSSPITSGGALASSGTCAPSSIAASKTPSSEHASTGLIRGGMGGMGIPSTSASMEGSSQRDNGVFPGV